MSLYAPLAVAVEVRREARRRREEEDQLLRVFRLSTEISDSAIELAAPLPFDLGEPVFLGFLLPVRTGAVSVSLRARVSESDLYEEPQQGQGSALRFVDPPREVRQAIVAYITERLGLTASLSSAGS